MKNINSTELERPLSKTVENLENALWFVEQSHLEAGEKTAITELIQMAGERLAKAVQS